MTRHLACVASAPLPDPAAALPTARHMLDLLPGLVAYFDRDLRYLYANATYARWADRDPRELVGRHCRDVVGRANYAAIARRMRRALRGETVSAEYTLFEGIHTRQVQGTYVPDRAEDGQVRGLIALVTEISARPDLQQHIDGTAAMMDDAFARAPIGMARVDTSGRLEQANDAFAAMLGYGPAEMVGIDFRDITHPEDIDLDDRLFVQVLDGRRDGYRIDKRYLHRDGRIVYATLVVSVVRNADGSPARFVSQIEDVSARRLAEAELARSNARLEVAIESIRGGLFYLDIATRTLAPSPHLERLVGMGGDAPLTVDAYLGRIHPADRAAASPKPLILGEIDRDSIEYRLETVEGWRWMRSDRRLLRDAQGVPVEIVGIVIDITEQRERQSHAERQADTDPLTGLLNRRGLDRRVTATRLFGEMGVMLIDLDGFKPVNDRYGHLVGDAVLAEAAARLQALVRDRDMVARLGGDEFLIAIPGASEATLAGIAGRINAALAAPFSVGDVEVSISASVGGAIRAPHAPIATAIAAADRALYRVKSSGRGAWALAS